MAEQALAIVEAVPLAVPWTVAQLCGWLEQATGKRVDVAPWPLTPAAAPQPAACLVHPGRLIVRFDGRRSPRHRLQQVMHELAHLIGDDPALLRWGRTESDSLAHISHRGTMATATELRAEMVGTGLAVSSRDIADLAAAGPFRSPLRPGAHRVRTLAVLWRALTEVVPDVRLGNADSPLDQGVAEHRMRVEIEDAVVALSTQLEPPPRTGDPHGWARALTDAVDRYRRAVPATASGAHWSWPGDEQHVLAIARAWKHLHCTASAPQPR
ncbi:DUF6545 domain-containing protein [Nocardia sp. alder85J]|uniref:DUF6545 domain-containing protein n=1 Tax=Nocardia sp. alder85J TaxID=2862949 RepID=UPI001CD45958|nr:DUF6545 domain-containing protein [Nocardia sp. alder85J]MCX4097679.1 hypothetical protein [Nocardia sp. alder85J]